jgi:hypothetical protein
LGRAGVLKRTLQTTLLLVAVACAPAAAASPQANTAAVLAAEASLDDTERLLDGRGVRTGRELTESLRELSTRLRHLRGDERARALALLSRPTDADAPPDEGYTLPELPPLCDANFCIHAVGSGVDAPGAGTAAQVLAEANAVRNFENGALGWRQPPDDGDGRVDIYLKELGAQRVFGFVAPDPGQDRQSQHSYVVLDNDFDPAQFGGAPAIESLRVTLAHEYAHVLQYGYDVLADGWHYESSAVWMEQQIYPQITDWLRYLEDRSGGEGWRSLTELPLTYFELNPDGPGALDPRIAKPYGDAVWNHFLSSKYGTAGNGLQLATWENSRGLDRASTAAYDDAIRTVGGPGLAHDFGEFSAAVAEWRLPQAPFFSPAQLPDVERRGRLDPNGPMTRVVMDHLTFALYDVPAVSSGPLRVAGSFPEGTEAAIALVARSGSIDGGQVTTELVHLPDGGMGGVTIDNPAPFYASGGRMTAVLVNADASHGLWDERGGDWHWLRDGQAATARASSDVRAPRAALRGFRLRSRDADRLTFTATLRQGGRIVGRRSGRLRPGAKRRLRIAGGAPGRARLVVRLADPAANTRRLARSVRLAA